MDNIFFVKLIISILVGAGWVVLATVLADKFGSIKSLQNSI